MKSKFFTLIIVLFCTTSILAKPENPSQIKLFSDKLIYSKLIEVHTPEIGNDRLQVPIRVISKLQDTQAIAILVRRNPTPLAAYFSKLDGLIPDIETNIKILESSSIIVVVKAMGKLYYTEKFVSINQ